MIYLFNMIKHYYKEGRKVRTILLLFIVSFLTINLSSCYLYEGPTRKKPQKPEIKLPPPEPKVYAEPVSKKEYINKAYNELKDVLEDAEVKLVEDSIKVLFPNNIVYDNRSTPKPKPTAPRAARLSAGRAQPC